MEDKKTNAAVLLIVILVIIIGLFLFLDKTGKLDGLKPKDETQVEKKEITDEKLSSELAKKVEIINLSYGDSSRPNGTASFFENELYKNINDARLLNGLIEYEHIHNNAIIYTVKDNSLYETYPNLLYIMPKDKVQELSNKIFNKDLSNITSSPEGDNVWLTFELVGDNYYISSNGGDPTSTDKAYTYIYKYEEEGNKAYVYLSVAKGIIDYDADGNDVYYIFKGLNTIDKYKTYNYDQADNYYNFKINTDNYNEFTKFKYTFEKENDNYKFVSIESVK